MCQTDFPEIERRLIAALDVLKGEFTAAERQEVLEFIDVGEYGVALETLAAIAVEEKKRLPKAVFDVIRDLAAQMGVEGTVMSEELHQRCLNI